MEADLGSTLYVKSNMDAIAALDGRGTLKVFF